MRFSALLFLPLLAVVAHAAPDAAGSAPARFSAKELAQGFRDSVVIARPRASHRARADADEAREGVRVREKFPRLGDLRIIDLDASDSSDTALARLRATERYEFVEPDYIVYASAEPNDPRFTDGSLWALKNTGASNGIAGADIKATAAWDIIHDAPNVVVAVVDTGVNLNHQDLVANLWTNPAPTFGDVHGARFINGSRSGTPSDDNGHGTHVAGTIGAVGNNGVAATGVAWRVQIMPVKVLGSSGSGSVSDIISGINYAVAHGANIINASYGGDANTGFSQAQLAAISAARDAGVIFVAAAGNSSANMDVSRFYPASYALDNIVSVAASGRRDEWMSFSNYGAAVDLFAPGSDIVSLNYASTTGTTTMSGTSMAAPQVSGSLALIKAQFPNDSYRQLINRLLRGVDAGSAFTTRAQTGGRLDVFRALTTTTNRPFNDDFADRPRLNGDNLAIRSSNAGATAEPGEPAAPGFAPAATLWWEWTAPTTGAVSLDTLGSGYDTVLSVYTAPNAAALTSPANLTLVATNDDTDQTVASRVTFSAQAGTTYEFTVDGKYGGTGLTLLNLGTTAANDLFASATVLPGSSTHLTATNSHASRETGEPHILGWAGGLSLWYRWTAPRSGHFQVSAISTDFDPILAVYTGSSVDALTVVALGDNNGPSAADNGALCSFDAVAGTTYSIAVDAKTAANTGQFTLSLTDSLWQAGTTASITGSPAVASDGTVYVGSTDNSLYAFAADGTQKWSYATGGIIDTCSPTIADDGTVYVGSNDGRFYALQPGGALKWSHDFGSAAPISNSPALAADGTIYLKPGDGVLYALNPADGSIKWSRNVFGPSSYASPSVAADGTIYQGSENGQLYAINPADGSVKWTYAAGDDIYSVPAIDAAGNIYVTVLNSGKLHCVSPNGVARWVFSGATLSSSSSPALSADGATVYFAAYDKKLYAVNTATGAARWTYALGDEARASSPAVDANGVVYIGAYDFKLYAINPDGTPKRTWDTGNWIRSCPAIAGQTLYVGSNDHKLYAFDLGVGGAAGAWPQYRHDGRRLGRALPSPSFTTQPASQSVALGASVTFTAAATGGLAPVYQWQHNGRDIAGATGPSLTVSGVQPADAGVYTVVATSGLPATSAPAVLGVLSSAKVTGAGVELQHDIVHPVTGYTYDQVLLTGSAATITADPGQITRMSYIDLNNDIVQVEFSGPGSLSLVLDNASGPALPLNYNQAVSYMKGHATIVIAGATANTFASVFSVGRGNAVNQSLFLDNVAYDGIADLALVAIASTDGKFGGLHTGNASYWSTRGLAGLYAPGVQFTDVVNLGNIAAFDAATPVLQLAASSNVNITGGDLFQPNGRAVQVSGLVQLHFVAGTTSANTSLPAQSNKARLEQNGADVTAQLVINPGQ
ncbi:MAG TPA: PQQ-binding-like beta-propeller repeat protein [Opitutaceae bacterium]|nr:PQQ-binding-like beta-propeller repeat protein [Opitutaceae bacterium]